MIEITIPKIGVEDGEVVLTTWEKEEGSLIEKNEIIATVETEKVNTDIMAPASGILKIKLEKGKTAKMTEIIGFILAEDKGLPNEKIHDSKLSRASTEQIEHKPEEKTEFPPKIDNQSNLTHLSPSARRKQMNSTVSKPMNSGRIIGSPAAKRIASELGINLHNVTGTGPNKAILTKDVYEARKNLIDKSQENSKEEVEKSSSEEEKAYSKENLTPIRKAIARNMLESLQNSAQMTLMGTVSLDKIWPFYTQMKEDLRDESLKPSWAAIFIKAVALALEEHRHLNGSYENDELIIWKEINIGVAVSTEKGLVVPCIKQANKKSLLVIHKELKVLAEKARNNRLKAEDLTGSTFTLTNVGSYGGELGTPMLNRKELGILGIGAVTKQPIVNDKDEIVIGRCCCYNLTVDHQMVDGEAAGLFIKSIKRLVNSPSLLLMS